MVELENVALRSRIERRTNSHRFSHSELAAYRVKRSQKYEKFRGIRPVVLQI